MTYQSSKPAPLLSQRGGVLYGTFAGISWPFAKFSIYQAEFVVVTARFTKENVVKIQMTKKWWWQFGQGIEIIHTNRNTNPTTIFLTPTPLPIIKLLKDLGYPIEDAMGLLSPPTEYQPIRGIARPGLFLGIVALLSPFIGLMAILVWLRQKYKFDRKTP